MGFVSRLLLVTGAIGASAWSIEAQSVPRAPEAPTNAIPAGLQDIAPCTGRRLIDPCGLGALPTPRPLPPIGPGSQLGARIVAAGHGPNVPFAPDAGPLFLHRVTKAQQARVDAEVAAAARRVRAARSTEP